jgi:hypothetical protein
MNGNGQAGTAGWDCVLGRAGGATARPRLERLHHHPGWAAGVPVRARPARSSQVRRHHRGTRWRHWALVVLVQLGRADCARPRACRRGGCDHRGPPAARGRARITRPCCQKPAARATERAPIHPASRAHHARMQPGRHLVSSHPPALPPSAGLAFCQVRQTPVTPRAIRVRHRLSTKVSFPGTEAQAWQRSARLRAGRARPGTPRRRSRTAGWWCACAASGCARRTSHRATGC